MASNAHAVGVRGFLFCGLVIGQAFVSAVANAGTADDALSLAKLLSRQTTKTCASRETPLNATSRHREIFKKNQS
jgi:hypothetical protein